MFVVNHKWPSQVASRWQITIPGLFNFLAHPDGDESFLGQSIRSIDFRDVFGFADGARSSAHFVEPAFKEIEELGYPTQLTFIDEDRRSKLYVKRITINGGTETSLLPAIEYGRNTDIILQLPWFLSELCLGSIGCTGEDLLSVISMLKQIRCLSITDIRICHDTFRAGAGKVAQQPVPSLQRIAFGCRRPQTEALSFFCNFLALLIKPETTRTLILDVALPIDNNVLPLLQGSSCEHIDTLYVRPPSPAVTKLHTAASKSEPPLAAYCEKRGIRLLEELPEWTLGWFFP